MGKLIKPLDDTPFRRMWLANYTVEQIAQKLGISERSVYLIRKRLGLPPRWRPKDCAERRASREELIEYWTWMFKLANECENCKNKFLCWHHDMAVYDPETMRQVCENSEAMQALENVERMLKGKNVLYYAITHKNSDVLDIAERKAKQRHRHIHHGYIGAILTALSLFFHVVYTNVLITAVTASVGLVMLIHDVWWHLWRSRRL